MLLNWFYLIKAIAVVVFHVCFHKLWTKLA